MKIQDKFDQLDDNNKVAMLLSEIQNIYILMREKSRAYPADGITFTSSKIRQEDSDIRKMDIF